MNRQEAMSNRRKVRNFLINPKYQLRYAFWTVASGLFLVGMYSIILYSKIKENYTLLVALSPMDDAAKMQLYLELNEIMIKLGIASAAFLFLMAFLALVVSHRTVGALYHFKRVFDEVREGRMGARIHLRPRDDFQEVAQSFNEMMEKIGPKARQDRHSS